MIDRLNADQKSKASLLRYFDATWSPAIDETRLVYHQLFAAGTAWRAKLDALAEPARADKPSQAPPKNRYLGNRALQEKIAQARRNMQMAVSAFSAASSTGSGTSAKEVALWDKVAKSTERFEAADAERAAIEAEYMKECAAWERKVADYKPVEEFDRELQTARSQLIGLIEAFNRVAPYDEVVTGREQFLNAYSSFVPTHHFFLSDVQGGTYVYVYEQNQIDVHLHCKTYNNEKVSLITFKKWGSNAGYSAARGDTYLGGKKGLTETPSHLAGVDATFVGLIAHLRAKYPPVDTRAPQRVEPKLPRQRGAL